MRIKIDLRIQLSLVVWQLVPAIAIEIGRRLLS